MCCMSKEGKTLMLRGRGWIPRVCIDCQEFSMCPGHPEEPVCEKCQLAIERINKSKKDTSDINWSTFWK